jgi:hypothetical protein
MLHFTRQSNTKTNWLKLSLFVGRMLENTSGTYRYHAASTAELPHQTGDLEIRL